MKTNFLFPHHYRRIGWLIFIPATVLGILYMWSTFDPPAFLELKVFAIVTDSFKEQDLFTIIENNIFDELIGLALILSLLFIAFSKEEIEDEFIRQMRLDALVWATMANAAVLIFCLIFIYDLAFFNFMVLNMFSVLFLFIVRFYWLMSRSKKMMSYEK